MADYEHVYLLKKNLVAWDEWRLDNRDIRPDLGGADLKAGHASQQ
jgi:hypothetical protein